VRKEPYPTACTQPPWGWGKRGPTWGTVLIFYRRTADQLKPIAKIGERQVPRELLP
jgi:hypothetical protein